MSRLTASIALLLLAALPDAHADILRIGIIAPLTGHRSDAGAFMKDAALLAQVHFQKASRLKLELFFQDCSYEPRKAVSAYRSLVDLNKVHMVVGPYGSSEVLAVAPLAEREGIILMAPGAQSDEITQAGDYIFRVIHNSGQEGPFFAPAVARLMRGRDLGVLAIQTAFSPAYLKYFTPPFTAAGKSIKLVEEFPAEELDLRPNLLRLKRAGVQDILMLLTTRQIAHALVQADQLGFTPKFFAFGQESPEIVELAGRLADGLVYAYPFDADSKEETVTSFVKAYQEAYRTFPDSVAAHTYDAVMLLARCAAAAKVDTPAVKACLYGTRNYHGASGVLSIDDNGDAVKEIFLKTIKNGRFERLTMPD